ncbi:abortive phage infection protein [Fructobacillus tropaeoli]|uniref:AIPR family protein n=1 Tax=Fructobacillus tropaeoli TaxID=709323 RepID=UPI001455F2BF|nr:AIPR family protein [Fructobacillus tropaeoli]NLS38630.1 abortive phage infection protein [Fructobacillus tropaeoli]
MDQKKNFKVSTLRTISSPSQPGVTTYIAYVNFHDLPDDFKMDINPRKPKMGTAVAKSLIAAVKSPDTDFDINNRGIVIVAKSLKYNTNTDSITLDLGTDSTQTGILDGGHTYTAIKEHRDEMAEDLDKFVRLEVIVGNDLTVSRIADARNTSASVSDIALYELDDKFDFIKRAVANEPYAEDIAIKDNSKERLPIIELLKLLFAYNVYDFTSDKEMPTQSYSSKAAVFKNVKNDLDKQTYKYEHLAKLLPSLVEFYDLIELTFRDKYLEYKSNGKFGAMRGITVAKNDQKKFKTLFLENDTGYQIAAGYLLPVFGAFRVLIDPETLEWKLDPKTMWDKIGADLVRNTLDSSRNNPQDAGKNTAIWSNNYSKVENEMLRQMLSAK